MKKYAATLLAGIIMLAVTAEAGSTYLGGNIGAGVANDNVDEGLALSGYLETDLSDIIGLRGTVGYFAGDTKVDRLSKGDFTMFSLEASVIAKMKRSDSITPYAGAGVGYYFPDTDLSSDLNTALIAAFGVRGEEEIDESLGFHILAGTAINVGQNVDLDLAVKYLFLEPDVDAKVTNITTFESVTVSEEIDLNTLFITAGLLITF